jgi:hypothetical protein
MTHFQSEQTIKQLEKRQGGYFYIKIDAEVVNQFAKKRATRLICTLDGTASYRCGLNHLGDGNFFIIIATKTLQMLGKDLGAMVHYEVAEDPDQLGVEMPEVLEALLAQDDGAKQQFDALTDGKKRGLIHTINRIKNVDKQVHTALAMLSR